MARVSREQYLDAAEALFAERGFYGVSIAAIAEQLGLTKQALLHHFGSKEKLYGEVLHRISEQFETLTAPFRSNQQETPNVPHAFFLELYATAKERPERTRLLMRELLDNNQRAETASTWYLKRFLEHIIAMIQTLPNWQETNDETALAAGYQIIGAINYFCISEPTLTGIFGRQAFAQVDAVFPEQLSALINAVLSTPR